MKISVFLATVLTGFLIAVQYAGATSLLNCSGATVRIVSHHRESVPSKDGVLLRSGMSHDVSVSGPDTVVKVFEVRLFDVLRISVSGLESDMVYVVGMSVDGRWTLQRRERC